MKSVKWIFLCGALAGLMTACEKHPADQVPGGHGPGQGHDHAEAAHKAPGAADSHAPAGHATPVPEYFPNGR